MQTVALSWQHSLELGAALTLAGGIAAAVPNQRVRNLGAFLRETAVIAALYGIWQLAGTLSVAGSAHAFARARWIERVEHDLFLPSERSMQHLVLGHRLLVQTANLYYATMHFTMMFVFLVWLFVRHRDRYRPVRQVLGWTTLGCLLVQLLPVAPPRMLPGIVDTAIVYGQSVYSNGFAVDQLSAMPSVHVAWAGLIGWYVWRVSPSKWRFIGPVHAALTVFVVVVTGNHWWADGIVAVAILAAAAWLVFGVRIAWQAILTRLRGKAVVAADRAAQPSRRSELTA